MYEVDREVQGLARSMRQITIVLSALIFFAPSNVQSSKGAADTRFTSARAYFVGWGLLSRVPLGIDDVIRMKRIYFEVDDPGLTKNFVDWLRLSEMEMRTDTGPGDARLVIELVDETGDVTIVYSDGSHLFSSDSARSRPVDEVFRDRFDLTRDG